MIIDFSTALIGLDGKQLNDAGKDLKLSDVCCTALLATYASEQNLDGNIKLKRWKIAEKIFGKNEVDISVEEINTIKELIEKAYGPGVIGPVLKLLDPSVFA